MLFTRKISNCASIH